MSVPPCNEGLSEEAEELLAIIKKRITDRSATRGVAEFNIGDEEESWYFLSTLAELVGKSQIRLSGKLSITLESSSYEEYLQSGRWRHKRLEAQKLARNRCQVCNAKGQILDTHHRTYERIGNELPEDLIVLCRPCHDTFKKIANFTDPEADIYGLAPTLERHPRQSQGA